LALLLFATLLLSLDADLTFARNAAAQAGSAISANEMAGDGIAAGLSPYLVGALVWGIGLSLGGTTGYAINPPRDFGPRLAHALLPVANKGNSDWGYATVPILGPLIGGALAGG
jgi:glycerol uptake facilitator protein